MMVTHVISLMLGVALGFLICNWLQHRVEDRERIRQVKLQAAVQHMERELGLTKCPICRVITDQFNCNRHNCPGSLQSAVE